MKQNQPFTLTSALLLGALPGVLSAQTTLLDASFDGIENDLNNTFSLLTNHDATASGATWDQETGTVTNTGGTNVTGAVSETTIDFPSVGSDLIVVTFEVENASGNLGYNGLFLGLQVGEPGNNLGSNLWNNLSPVLGVNFSGRSNPPREVRLAHAAPEAGEQFLSLGQTASAASMADGFTIILTLSATQWDLNIEGLETEEGSAISGTSGEWADLSLDFADLPATMRVASSIQQGQTIDLARIKVEQFDTSDSDEDGLPDYYELANGLNANNPADASADADADGGADGLTNLEEFAAGTNPQDSDSDDDGLKDGEEVKATLNPYDGMAPGTTAGSTGSGLPTDPLDPDSDDDGLSDFEELDNGNGSISNPWTDDTDDDLLLDAFEIAYNLDPTSTAPPHGDADDPDEDGADNYEEQLIGSDPRNPDSDGDGLTDGEEYIDTTDPTNPDTDGDNLNDFEEKQADTDPKMADSDQDGFPDYLEVVGETDPLNFDSFPSYAPITWSVDVLDSLDDLVTTGALLYAENMNGEATTVNGVPFTGHLSDTSPRGTANILTFTNSNIAVPEFYQGPVSEFVPLLTTSWSGGASSLIVLTGLTPGETYLVQTGRSDNRNFGSIPGRYMTADGFGGEDANEPVGPNNTIFGGAEAPALIFTGLFTATGERQVFDWSQYNAGGSAGGTNLAFVQVRVADFSAPIEVTAYTRDASGIHLSFGNLDPAKSYQLTRSSTLEDGFPLVVAGPRQANGPSDTFTDTSSEFPGRAFYRLEEVPAN
ncbi:hypothetical protein [Roseibacillus ishigakijimensis]|uniref:Thrombospondin type 3 repeat-containing protein n=1 Tax=Roseibacillus ishigakijimensis TaxID=454146 RepID=A0A934RVU7_9BACT|nr:hypothetical protein [Roseibacillus ishigakijimensis]MBK1835386.1 hypothetical protein [Roseibacillus ishigakijimensis]